ncbi:UbiH/UbiF family hydroxylase [Terrihabitans sp. B22-R8]|uniref:UbiH/UbiF family hydroxylase n=1 Tax=Terrihabitans sp. B22-R8 TaxID=3425128 RepID=UPI00403D3826
MGEAFSADVIVAGGGPAGLVAAHLLALGDVRVALIAPQPPPDNRTTALMHGSLQILVRIGLWPRLMPHTGALRQLRIVDASGALIRAPEALFRSEEIGLNAFGHNIENRALVGALREMAEARPNIRIHDAPAVTVEPGSEGVAVNLADGQSLRAPLVVGADGRNSICRKAAGLTVRVREFPQAALTFNIRHTRPHLDTSTEFHYRGGPFTLVPLPGDRSSVVLVMRPDEAARTAALELDELGAFLERRSEGLLGRIEPEARPASRPLASLTASRFAAARVALVGESGHILPPIGAQGLNLGLRDAETLADLVATAHKRREDVGSADLLGRYDSLRRRDIGPRSLAVDLLNRSLLPGLAPMQLARAAGLFALSRIGPLRGALVREGLAFTPNERR